MKQWALIIGVGQRSDDSQAMAITSKDATRVATELEDRCDLDRNNISLLLEKEATKEKILAELENLINKTRNNEADIIWIYFSGHGCQLQSNDTKEYFLIANDTIATDLINSAILGSEFIDKINQINTKKILLLLDCCHAGGISMSKSSIPFNAEQLLSRSNRVVISASHAEEVAFPSQPLSVFTFAFVEGLAGAYLNEGDKNITIFDLAMYIRERVYPLTKRKQRPQFSIFNNKNTENFILVNYPNGKPLSPAFDSEFVLSDGKGKMIDLNTSIERDEEFRKEFEWLSKNQNTIIGDNNIVINTESGNVSYSKEEQHHTGSGDSFKGDKIITTVTNYFGNENKNNKSDEEDENDYTLLEKIAYIKLIHLSERKEGAKPIYKRYVPRLNRDIDVYDEAQFFRLIKFSKPLKDLNIKDRSSGVVDLNILHPWQELEFTDYGAADVENIIEQVINMKDSNIFYSAMYYLNGFQKGKEDYMTKMELKTKIGRLIIDFSSLPKFKNFVTGYKGFKIARGTKYEMEISTQQIRPGIYHVTDVELDKGDVIGLRFEIDWEKI